MAAKMTSDIGYSAEVRAFRQLSFCLIVEVIAECMWLLLTRRTGAGVRFLLYFSCTADLLCIGYTVYFWYRFMDVRVTPRAKLLRRPRVVDVFWAIPVAVMTVLDALSPITGMTFTLSAGGVYRRGPWFPLHALCCFVYAVPVLHLVVQSWKQQDIDRQRFRMYLIFPILLVVGGILQIAVRWAPFSTVTFTFGMFLLFSSLQQRRINTDALTRLNNRAGAKAYLTTRLDRAESEPFYLFMADVDHFKGINDRYGHIMGDEALVLVADTLRDLAKDYRTLFISRYGGDEFLFTIAAHEVDPERLKRRFAVDLAKALEASGHPFRFTVSLGCALADTSGISQKALIDQADKGMYNWKNDRK
ncbi:MAG: diguanylate cyclase domain-containing protein [Pseudoramibacter sp.]